MNKIRFFPALIIVLAVAMLAANGLWLLPAIDALNAGVSNLHLEVARRASSALRDSINVNRKALKESASLIGQDPRSAGEIMARLLNNNPSIEEAVFVDMNGAEKARVSRTKFISSKELVSRKGEASFEEIASGRKIEYGGPVFFSLLAEPLVDFSVQIKNPSGSPVGVLVAENNLRFVWDLMSQVNVGGAGTAYVVDQNKNLIAHPNPSIVLRGENLSYRPIVNQVVSGRVVDGLSADDPYINFEGEKVFAVGLPVENLGWGVIVENNYDEAFSSRRRVIVFALFFIVSVIGLFAVIFWSLRRIIGLFAALELEKKQTSAIISNLTDGLIEYADDFKIILVNPAAENILGIRADEIIGRRFEPKDSTNLKFSSFSKVLFPILAEDARAIRADGDHLKMIELKIHHPLDRDLQIITVPVLGEQGRIFSYLKVIRDISREKAIAKTKSEFISLAAHQLRTPLSAIKWVFSMILSGDMGPVGPEIKPLIDTGFRSNERMIALVNDLLNVARIEEGRFGYKFEPGNLVETVKDVVDSFDILSKEYGTKIKFIPPGSSFPAMVYDKEKLSLAINNLIDNAMRYTHKSDGLIEVGVFADGDFAKISVKDNGIGISKEQLERLFTKFHRGPNAIKMYTEGSGLGLFIVKNIVKRHGGDVVVESEEGQGSVFTLLLPIDASKIPPVAEVYEGV